MEAVEKDKQEILAEFIQGLLDTFCVNIKKYVDAKFSETKPLWKYVLRSDSVYWDDVPNKQSVREKEWQRIHGEPPYKNSATNIEAICQIISADLAVLLSTKPQKQEEEQPKPQAVQTEESDIVASLPEEIRQVLWQVIGQEGIGLLAGALRTNKAWNTSITQGSTYVPFRMMNLVSNFINKFESYASDIRMAFYYFTTIFEKLFLELKFVKDQVGIPRALFDHLNDDVVEQFYANLTSQQVDDIVPFIEQHFYPGADILKESVTIAQFTRFLERLIEVKKAINHALHGIDISKHQYKALNDIPYEFISLGTDLSRFIERIVRYRKYDNAILYTSLNMINPYTGWYREPDYIPVLNGIMVKEKTLRVKHDLGQAFPAEVLKAFVVLKPRIRNGNYEGDYGCLVNSIDWRSLENYCKTISPWNAMRYQAMPLWQRNLGANFVQNKNPFVHYFASKDHFFEQHIGTGVTTHEYGIAIDHLVFGHYYQDLKSDVSAHTLWDLRVPIKTANLISVNYITYANIIQVMSEEIPVYFSLEGGAMYPWAVFYKGFIGFRDDVNTKDAPKQIRHLYRILASIAMAKMAHLQPIENPRMYGNEVQKHFLGSLSLDEKSVFPRKRWIDLKRGEFSILEIFALLKLLYPRGECYFFGQILRPPTIKVTPAELERATELEIAPGEISFEAETIDETEICSWYKKSITKTLINNAGKPIVVTLPNEAFHHCSQFEWHPRGAKLVMCTMISMKKIDNYLATLSADEKITYPLCNTICKRPRRNSKLAKTMTDFVTSYFSIDTLNQIISRKKLEEYIKLDKEDQWRSVIANGELPATIKVTILRTFDISDSEIPTADLIALERTKLKERDILTVCGFFSILIYVPATVVIILLEGMEAELKEYEEENDKIRRGL